MPVNSNVGRHEIRPRQLLLLSERDSSAGSATGSDISTLTRSPRPVRPVVWGTKRPPRINGLSMSCLRSRMTTETQSVAGEIWLILPKFVKNLKKEAQIRL